MTRDAARILLLQNVGFGDPEPWIDYAAAHNFTRVLATPVPRCPDCGSPPRAPLGQYVYYSTLIRLQACRACHLVWSDVHLDPDVVREHFATAYKDRDYFLRSRAGVFEHLAREIGRLTPRQGRVLDVGGAQGDLMHLLKTRRPDLNAVVHDLSESAVRYAREAFGLEGVSGDIRSLERHAVRYDVVVLSDVLYYEPGLADVWRILGRLLVPGGSVVIRVPNKLAVIRARQWLSRLSGRDSRLEDRIRYFNPEHIYVLSQRYLRSRLLRTGFAAVHVMSSPPLVSDRRALRTLSTGLFRVADAVNILSGRRLVLTPSMLVVGTGLADRR